MTTWIKIFSRTTGPISIKFSSIHPWVKGILEYSNEGPLLFPRGDYYEIGKIHWQNLKIFFYRTTASISTKLSKKHPWVKRIWVCSNEKATPFYIGRGDNNRIAKVLSQNSKLFSWTAGLVLWYFAQIYLLIWTGFSGERCGLWASCLLCRRYYKEEDELVLDVGSFAKALEVKNSKLSCIGKQFYTFMVKGITIIKP